MQTEFVLSVIIALCVFLPRVMGQCDQGLDCGEQQETVVMTSVVYRHGARTSVVRAYPTDPNRNNSLWELGLGQLTPLGEEMHFELGSWLRRRYSNLLPATYNLRDIYVLSTDLDRTLMSAESNLAGLYPATDPTSPLRAQPVPIRSRPGRDDDLIGGGKPCPRLYQLMRLVLSSPGGDCIRKNFDPDFQYIRLHTGVNKVGIIEACLLLDVLTIEQVHNMTLPEWTEGLDRMRLESLMNFVVGVLPSATREIQRLNSGNLIGELINHMVQKRNNSLSPNREMFMYSAHDITLSGIQMALGVYEAYPIPFAAAVLIELLVDQQQKYYVKVFYRNSTEHEPYLLTLPKCSSSCPLDTFIQLTQDLIPQDWKKECELRSTQKELRLRMPNIGNMVEWLDCFQKYGNIDNENQVN